MERKKDKAKVGILTFHCSDNYGAMLQAYGLKQYLCSHDIKTDIVPYEPPYMTGRHWWIPYIPIGKVSRWFRFARSGWKSHRLMGKNFFRLRKNMKAFRRKYLLEQGQHRLFFASQLNRLSYETYIVGSDQIWNPDITCGLRKEYFGGFENEKKKKVIAYAASMGGAALAERYDEEFSELLKNMDAISTREEAAVPYVNKFYKKRVTAVLDPVFFLGREEWERIEALPKEQGYILVHMTERTQEIVDYAKELSKEKGLPVIELRTNIGGVTEESFSVVYTAGPAEFLGYIKKADYVITNSFHMTAFGIIYQKQFVIFLHKSLGARIHNILKIHGLEDRLYSEEQPLDIDALPNWDEVMKRTRESRKVSENYLMGHLLGLHVEKEECCGCGACEAVCHTGALRMLQDDEGFRYPYINEKLCTHCDRCKQVCPLKSESSNLDHELYFGAQAKNEKVRHSSSSGGVFSAIAQFVLSHSGVVYGAGYNEHMEVVHQEVSNSEQLERIKRTKYVQSNIEGLYPRIEQKLKAGQWVLFCGTPCQAQSLKLYLNQTYDRLIIADLICYGVPSPGMWSDYVRYLEQEHGGRMTDFSFRDKRNKDNGHMRAYIIDGMEYVDSLYEDIYCRIYFTNYILRPSCHSCKFCKPERDSDITIGDFWGIENVEPEVDDGMGTSLVIVHTDKGKKVWNQIKGNLNWFECEREEVLQPRLQTATNAAKGRESFMQQYMAKPFTEFIKEEQEKRKRW